MSHLGSDGVTPSDGAMTLGNIGKMKDSSLQTVWFRENDIRARKGYQVRLDKILWIDHFASLHCIVT